MKVSSRATQGHLIVGVILIILSFMSMLASLLLEVRVAAVPIVLVFFFGVWGGVELGRFLEYSLSKKTES
jgi:hypothetical protein